MVGRSAKKENYVSVLVRSLEFFEMEEGLNSLYCRSAINSDRKCGPSVLKFGRVSWCTQLYHWHYWTCTSQNRCRILVGTIETKVAEMRC